MYQTQSFTKFIKFLLTRQVIKLIIKRWHFLKYWMFNVNKRLSSSNSWHVDVSSGHSPVFTIVGSLRTHVDSRSDSRACDVRTVEFYSRFQQHAFFVSVWAATQKKKRGYDSTTYVNLLPICCIRSATQWKCICWRWNMMHVNSTWDKRTVLQRPRGLCVLVTDNVTGMPQRRTASLRELTVLTWFYSPLSAAAFL